MSLLAAITLVMTTGCFMGPMLDNRSPFDDPSNASRSEIAAALPPIQEALDATAVDAAWRIVAESESDNCEGPCNLRVQVSIEPADTDALTAIERPDLVDNGFTRFAVPQEVLEAVLVAAVPVAERQKVDVYVVPGLGDPEGDVEPLADLSSAVEGLFPDGGDPTVFAVDSGEGSEGWVRAFTRTRTDVLTSMGLG